MRPQPGRLVRRAGAVGIAGATAVVGYRLLVEGGLTVDTGWGRTVRPLGSLNIDIAAPPDLVFDVLAEPYLGRTSRAMADKLEVVERGADLVLAAHHTPIRRGLVATTLETVRFQRPHRIDFRLVRGPVPYVVEHFLLAPNLDGTSVEYGGELGTDFWLVGRWWGNQVASKWEQVVRATFDTVKAEAERRSGAEAR